MSNRILFFAILLNPFFAQSQSLTEKEKKHIVDSISVVLTHNYVDYDKSIMMSKKINDNYLTGNYKEMKDPVEFADNLSQDILTVFPDKHFFIEYNPVRQNANQNNDLDSLAEVQDNYGFKRVEVLRGNIGYLELNSFSDLSERVKEITLASFKLLSQTKMLIIDLRNNGGGSGETVRYLAGFFFKNKTHINDCYDRFANTVKEYYTTPDPSFTSFNSIPLFILVSDQTFSAAEEFAYDLQSQKRATIIGSRTMGGANPSTNFSCCNGFIIHTPYAKSINPITKTNWEGKGVIPEIKTKANALDTAEYICFNEQFKNTKDTLLIKNLNWQLTFLKAENNPVTIDTLTLQSYAGNYGERKCWYEKGKLFYQRAAKPVFSLSPLKKEVLKGNDYFKVEFIKDKNNKVVAMRVCYADGRIEYAHKKE